MLRHRPLPLLAAILLAGCAAVETGGSPAPTEADTMREFIVIAHRGASGYLPEHTLEGVAMAHAMGVDYIEQDVVMTRDGELVVLHDLYLDAMTDVADLFPGRQREDGHYYALDFTLAEIRSLRVGERVDERGQPRYPGRFPIEERLFRVPTLAEEIRLVQGLNRSTGRDIGLYVEPKAPAWHRAQGFDLVAAVLDELARHGLDGRDDRVYLQSFDFDELRRARDELGSELKLVQLIGENAWNEGPSDFEYLRSAAGLREIAAFAQGIGPWLPQVVGPARGGGIEPTGLAPKAQALGLTVHAYTLRMDQLPPGVADAAAAVRLLVDEAGLDGVFTDQPDQVIRQLPRR